MAPTLTKKAKALRRRTPVPGHEALHPATRCALPSECWRQVVPYCRAPGLVLLAAACPAVRQSLAGAHYDNFKHNAKLAFLAWLVARGVTVLGVSVAIDLGGWVPDHEQNAQTLQQLQQLRRKQLRALRRLRLDFGGADVDLDEYLAAVARVVPQGLRVFELSGFYEGPTAFCGDSNGGDGLRHMLKHMLKHRCRLEEFEYSFAGGTAHEALPTLAKAVNYWRDSLRSFFLLLPYSDLADNGEAPEAELQALRDALAACTHLERGVIRDCLTDEDLWSVPKEGAASDEEEEG